MADAIDLTGEEATTALAATEQQHDGALAMEEQLKVIEEELHDLEETLAALRNRQHELHQQKEELQRQIAAEKHAPKADWSSKAFAWDQKVQQVLQSVFGLQDFRPLQREVINATLHGRDVLLLLPSGGGKSLCYQLPAVVGAGVTLVISPLLSLIVDQIMGLSGRVQAYSLTSLTSKEEAASVMAALTAAAASSGKGKGSSAAAKQGSSTAVQPLLLYVTPEKIVASKRLMAKLEKIYQAGQLSRIAVDEAHCCSTWGNDFRPGQQATNMLLLVSCECASTDYKKLGVLKQQFPDTPLIALTATATQQVCRDITSILRIGSAEHFTASINRPNLLYEVRHKPSSPEAAADYICSWIQENSNGESGIVYCLTRKDCEALAGHLRSAGISAAHYHADMEPGARTAAHNAWASGAVQVMVATIAFGMGINKPDVRWVLHACLSKSLENYYQESGRAGRDGKAARCVLCYRLGDVLRQAAVVCMDPAWQRHLMAVTSYAAARGGCRRAMLAAHFAEGPPSCNGMCDLCATAREAATGNTTAAAAGRNAPQQQQQDITVAALCALASLQERKGEKRATLNQLLDDMQKATRKAAATSKRGGGSSSALSKNEHEWVVEQLLLQGLLGLEFGFTAYATNTYLTATAAGEAFSAAQGAKRLTAAKPTWVSEIKQQHTFAAATVQGSSKMQQHSNQQLQQGQQQYAAKRAAAAHAVLQEHDEESDEDFLPVGNKQQRTE